MSTERLTESEIQLRKESLELAGYKPLMHVVDGCEPGLEWIIQSLSLNEVQQHILGDITLTEDELSVFRGIFSVAKSDLGRRDHLLINPQIFAKLKLLEKYVIASRQDKGMTQDTLSTEVVITDNISSIQEQSVPPQLGERLLLLILTKDERINIPGDLEEEYRGIAAKHGARYAKLWYYKQVAASAWPLIRKAIRWGVLAWIGEWIRRIV